jgi:hypothetical protein
MAAGLGFKTFTTGEVLTAADTNGYLMQGILVFADAAARDAAITSPQEGQFAYLKDTDVTTYYTSSAWANLDTTGMTNPMTTTADIIYSSSGSTPARLGIGTVGQVLSVNSGATAPEWAAPSAPSYNWTAYTPTFTNLTTGNGTIDFRYAQVGKVVFVDGSFTLGSTSSISGYVEMTLPVTANRIKQAASLGVVTLRDAGTAWYLGYVIDANSATAVEIIALNASGTYTTLGSLSATVPFTWTTSDFFTVNFTYEAA